MSNWNVNYIMGLANLPTSAKRLGLALLELADERGCIGTAATLWKVASELELSQDQTGKGLVALQREGVFVADGDSLYLTAPDFIEGGSRATK